MPNIITCLVAVSNNLNTEVLATVWVSGVNEDVCQDHAARIVGYGYGQVIGWSGLPTKILQKF